MPDIQKDGEILSGQIWEANSKMRDLLQRIVKLEERVAALESKHVGLIH